MAFYFTLENAGGVDLTAREVQEGSGQGRHGDKKDWEGGGGRGGGHTSGPSDSYGNFI